MTPNSRPSARRLGFAVNVAGRPDLKDHDGRAGHSRANRRAVGLRQSPSSGQQPHRVGCQQGIGGFFATWPNEQTPKIHVSSQRMADRSMVRKDRSRGMRSSTIVPAKPGQHDDFIDERELVALLDAVKELEFDVMLEAKQKDLAVLRLREDLAAAGRPDLAW